MPALGKSFERAAQQGFADSRAGQKRVDIERIDLAVETEIAVARGPGARHADDAVFVMFPDEHEFLAFDRHTPARGLAFSGHRTEQLLGENAGIGVVPGLDIDARDFGGVVGPRQPYGERKRFHKVKLRAVVRARQEQKIPFFAADVRICAVA